MSAIGVGGTSAVSEHDPFGILFGLSQARPQRILNLPRSQPALKPKGQKLSVQEIQYVQNLIERCLQWYLGEGEVIETLFREAGIEPGLTALVWNKLLEQNPTFFRAYTTRVLLKEQVVAFNNLVQHHASVSQQQQQQAGQDGPSHSATSALQLSESASPPQQAKSPGGASGLPVTSPPMRLPLVSSPRASRLIPAYTSGPIFIGSAGAGSSASAAVHVPMPDAADNQAHSAPVHSHMMSALHQSSSFAPVAGPNAEHGGASDEAQIQLELELQHQRQEEECERERELREFLAHDDDPMDMGSPLHAM
eukprot:m51a1_g2602 hypothetical protein (308) ;mRNA; r:462247-463329